jgi:hypothetical protein
MSSRGIPKQVRGNEVAHFGPDRDSVHNHRHLMRDLSLLKFAGWTSANS